MTLLLAALYLTARDAGPLQSIEGQTLDWRFQIRGPLVPEGNVVLVTIDDRTLAELGRWPLSRSWLTEALDAISADGARGIVFDLLLVGSETVSGSASGQAVSDPNDRALAESMLRAGNAIVPYAFVFEPSEANLTVAPPTIQANAYAVVRAQAGAPAGLPTQPAGILAPLDVFLETATPAHVTVFLEADGSLRFAHPVIGFDEDFYPSLPVEAARIFLGLDRSQVTLDLGRSVTIGDRVLPTGRDMAWAINFTGPPDMFETWSLVDVVQGKVPAETFQGKVVLIGATALGLGDRFVTPYSAKAPGVTVFANIIDNILASGFLKRTQSVLGLDLVFILLGGVCAIALGTLRRPLAVLIAMVALLAAWSALNVAAFVVLQTWLNFTFPAVAILLGGGIMIAGRTLRESRLRQSAEGQRDRLTRYVSPLAAQRLQADAKTEPDSLQRTATIMFVDLVGFTKASESMSPEETADLLRRFHGTVEVACQSHGGVIDKFIGDGALVVFGVTSTESSHEADALHCARRIADDTALWDGERRALGKPGIACGIGLHSGPITIAELGGASHGQITVAGDTVNVASRLEAMTRDKNATILMSEDVYAAVSRDDATSVLTDFVLHSAQTIRGREQPLDLWAWPAPSDP